MVLQSGLRQRGCLNGTAGAVALLLGALLARGLINTTPMLPLRGTPDGDPRVQPK